jgi:signal transduction histidine kinase
MSPTMQRGPRHRPGAWVRYMLAIAGPLAAAVLAVRVSMPAFVFEHLMVLMVVALALRGGPGPAIVAAVVASVGDNILLREPVGRPAIDGFRDVTDFVLFVVVAATVGWLVNGLRAAKEDAVVAAERERVARRQRDQLVVMVTHDLATPLTAIQGTIQFVRQNTALPAAELPRLLARIETAAARATSLVRTLRDVRSLEEDALLLHLQRADLRSIVEPTVRILERVSDRHPIALVVPESPLPVDCDVERVARVIENLITNAIKYSPHGGAIDISMAEQDGFAVVRVEDRGIGIPPRERERLFDLGYRSDEAAVVAPGLGVGLYIAAAIVRRHRGTLDAHDRDSGGSVFTVRLPLAAGGRPSLAGPAPDVSEGAPFQYALE